MPLGHVVAYSEDSQCSAHCIPIFWYGYLAFFFVLPTNSCLDFGIQFWIGSVIMHMGWQEGWFEHGSAQRVL
jgi:hypothetical protein